VDPDDGQSIVKSGALYVLTVPTGLFLVLFLFFPLSALFVSGLKESTSLPLLGDSFFWHTVLFTYVQAFFSALLSGLFGTLGALLYSEQKFLGRDVFWRWSLLCFALPTILVALSFAAFWGKNGPFQAFMSTLGMTVPFNFFYGWPAILVAHVFFNYPLYLKSVGLRLKDMDRSEEKAALSLGASRPQCFFLVTLRKLLPPLKNAFFLSFLYSSTSFLIVLILGGGPRFTTLEVAIYQATKIQFDLALAVRLALIQVLVTLTVYLLFLRENPIPSGKIAKSAFIPLYLFHERWKNTLVLVGYGLLFALLVVGPLVTLIKDGIFPWHPPNLLEIGTATKQSLILALLVATCVSFIGFSLAYAEKHWESRWVRRVISLSGNLPLSLSTILLTLSLIVAYPKVLAEWRGSLTSIACAQSLICLPIIYRIFREAFSSIDTPLYQSAASLGSDAFHTLIHIELPLMKNSILLAGLIAIGFSLGEIGAVMMFASDEILTLPLWIYRLMSQYRFQEASNVGVVLLSLMAVIYWQIGQLERK